MWSCGVESLSLTLTSLFSLVKQQCPVKRKADSVLKVQHQGYMCVVVVAHGVEYSLCLETLLAR